MELSEKLQELRKEKGLTQEELAEALFVSRTAISKWESGRGVPNIESLKAISKFFSVSIDELLSGEEILKIADEDNKQKEKHTRDLVFGLLDCSLIMFLFLPFFGQKGDEIIKEVSLLSLTGTPQYIKIPYLIKVSLQRHNHKSQQKPSQPTLKRRFFRGKGGVFSWPGFGKEWC